MAWRHFIGHLGDRTGVYHTYPLSLLCVPYALLPPAGFTDSRGLREIQLAPQRIVNRRLILKYIGIYHEPKSDFRGKGTHYYYIFPTFAQFIKNVQ